LVDLVRTTGKEQAMFAGFQRSIVDTGEARICVRHGGSGPPLLLLHGHPQTHVCWHRIAPRLAADFTVVAPDLRGYGDSSKPPTTPDHEPYSKRAVARDHVAVMRHLGFERFAVAGHDRGAYGAYRLALDHPARVERLAVLDIVPAGEAWRRADRRFMLAWWHWAFLAQPAPLAENLLTANPEAYYFRHHREVFAPEALAEYLRAVHDPATIHAMCEDYRANATYDYQLDEADRAAGRRIRCPLLVLWARHDDLEELYGDPLAIWREWAESVEGHGIAAGHYLAEEAPEETYTALHTFFSR
jgi:haloacetate dehalogenase